MLAFLFAVTAAFASVFAQRAYYYDSGMAEGVEGDVQQSETCSISSTGQICTVNFEWAFDTKAHAEANGGAQSNPSALGLLKRP